MEWINIKEQLPPVNKRVLVLWKNSHDEIVHSVTSRSRISRYCGKDAPIDDRYWIYASRHEIKPMYWMCAPEPPKQTEM
jgi:hypothetical protein